MRWEARFGRRWRSRKAVGELAELVEEEYEIRSDQAQEDVNKFVEEMRSNGLVISIGDS